MSLRYRYNVSVLLSESIWQVLKTKLQTPCGNSRKVSVILHTNGGDSSAATLFDVSLHLYLQCICEWQISSLLEMAKVDFNLVTNGLEFAS